MERERTGGSEFGQNDLVPVKQLRVERAGARELWDFSINRRVLTLSGIAVFLGAASAEVALVLLRLIGLATNLFYWAAIRRGAPGDLDG